MDLLSHKVTRAGKSMDLQPREFRLLEYLMRHAGQVVTRTMLLENVWDYHFDPQTNVIDVHISRLRQKLDKGFDKPLLNTVRGAGYMLDEPEQDFRASLFRFTLNYLVGVSVAVFVVLALGYAWLTVQLLPRPERADRRRDPRTRGSVSRRDGSAGVSVDDRRPHPGARAFRACFYLLVDARGAARSPATSRAGRSASGRARNGWASTRTLAEISGGKAGVRFRRRQHALCRRLAAAGGAPLQGHQRVPAHHADRAGAGACSPPSCWVPSGPRCWR